MDTHVHFTDLMSGYALNALDEQESSDAARGLLDHIAGCEPCRESYIETREAVAELAFALEPEPVPAHVTARLMNSIASESTTHAPIAQGSGRVVRMPLRMRLVAVAAVAMVGALGAWNLSLSGDIGDLRSGSRSSNVALQVINDPLTKKTTLTGAPKHGTVTVALRPNGDAVLLGTRLPDLPEGKLYELWLVIDGAPTPSITFRPEGGTAIETVAIDSTRVTSLAITVENKREKTPTRAPTFQGVLSA